MKERVTAVIDTSVYINIFKSQSQTSNSWKIWKILLEEKFVVASTKKTLGELIIVLKRMEFEPNFIANMVKTIVKKGILYEGVYSTDRLNDIDPKDNIFLAACLESNADYLISLDKKHILPEKYFHGTQILMPDGFLRAMDINDNYLPSDEVVNFIRKEMAYIIK